MGRYRKLQERDRLVTRKHVQSIWERCQFLGLGWAVVRPVSRDLFTNSLAEAITEAEEEIYECINSAGDWKPCVRDICIIHNGHITHRTRLYWTNSSNLDYAVKLEQVARKQATSDETI